MTRTAPRTVECRLYRFYGQHPITGRKTLLYVGETGRLAFERLLEHVYDKPWADTITSWEVDPRVFASKAAVLAAEEATVRAEKPLYNVEYNLDNPAQIPLWDQETQRWARDDAAGRPRWQAKERRPRTNQPSAARRATPTPRQLGMDKTAKAAPMPVRYLAGSWVLLVVGIAGAGELAGLSEDWQGWVAVAGATGVWGRWVLPAWWRRRR